MEGEYCITAGDTVQGVTSLSNSCDFFANGVCSLLDGPCLPLVETRELSPIFNFGMTSSGPLDENGCDFVKDYQTAHPPE